MIKFKSVYFEGFGFEIKTLLDVGVYRGTFELYEAFHSTKIVLIDPLAEVAKVERKMRAEYDVEFVQLALGAARGREKFYVPVGQNLSGSSLLRRALNIQHKRQLEEREVEIIPLDMLVRERGYSGPFGLKIDTEGYERAVIDGARRVLDETCFVVIELTLRNIYERRVLPSEIVAMLAASGFELFDVLNIGLTNPVYLDCLFLRKDDPRFAPRYSNEALLA